MCQKNSKTEEVKEIEVDIQQGRIKRTDEYEYLGNWVNEKGNIDRQAEKMDKKAQDVIRVSNTMCSKARIGRMEFTAKKLVYEGLSVPAVFYNIEVWSNLRKKDKEKLESIQGKIIKGTYGLPKSTPYWGVLYELDILPINLLLTYKKLMIYHKLINSRKERIARKIVMEQEALGLENCWYGNARTEAEEIGVELKKEKVLGMKKSRWKKEVKGKVRKAFQDQFEKKKETMTKLRFLSSKATQTYMKELTNEEARMAMIIRLNMFETFTHNFGNRKKCTLCGNENDTTEHAFVCPKRKNKEVTIEDLMKGERMAEIVEMCLDLENQRRNHLIDEIITNSNVLQREEWAEKKHNSK